MVNRTVYVILAYDRREYREKVRELRNADDVKAACVYPDSPEKLRGLDVDKVITCDGFWQRDDAVEIAQVANNRLK
jgi:hypothetical protein